MFQPNNPYGQNQGNSPYNQYRRPRRQGGCLAWLALLVLLGGGGWLAYLYLQNNPSSVSFLGGFFSSSTFTILGVIGIVLLIVVVALARASRGTALGKLLGGLSTVMVMAGVVVVLLLVTFLNPHVGMTRTDFTSGYVSIFSHNKVTFQNPTDGVTQILCIGTNQQCEKLPSVDDPSQLTQGLVIQPGQSVSIEFDHYGSYYITSKNTPHMNLKIIVTGTNKVGGD
jgi:hypothetical protein